MNLSRPLQSRRELRDRIARLEAYVYRNNSVKTIMIPEGMPASEAWSRIRAGQILSCSRVIKVHILVDSRNNFLKAL